MLSLVLLAAVSATPAAGDPTWETYVCESGPTIRLALLGDRPASAGYLDLGTGIITLEPHKGEPPAVLRGQGYMVRPFNWTDILYAPPGREKSAYQCQVQGAADRAGRPGVE
ncbi:hypothetical protein sos41_38110 [Alphaproteobacteria bacterium SO-S41]|nr:hypothetical protein sos41_38110 [Alphaproteobacteria bacterium SO-S41]